MHKKTTEVDFVANLGNKRYYIQSALMLPTREKRIQEKKSLLGIKDCFRKIIITTDTIGYYQDENGILVMGLKQFLLNKGSLDI